jgi:hypothetical protein
VTKRAAARQVSGRLPLITVAWVLCECPPAMAAVPQARPDWAGEFDRVWPAAAPLSLVACKAKHY